MTGSRWIRTGLWVALGVVVVVAALGAILALRFQPMARNYFIAALKQHYKSDVSLGNLSISLFPQVRATGDNLVFRLAGRPNEPPLVIVRRFTFVANFAGFFRTPRHIRKLTLEGLELHIPPKSDRPQKTAGQRLAAEVRFGGNRGGWRDVANAAVRSAESCR